MQYENPALNWQKNQYSNGRSFWENTTDEQFRIYAEVLKMLESYWKNEQSKSIE